MKNSGINKDERVIQAFGEEWNRFDQFHLSDIDRKKMFDDFFLVFPWDKISSSSVGADFGCGSGRWALMVAPRVGHLHLIDASNMALDVARRNLHEAGNVSFHLASIDAVPLDDGSLDFAYSLGVLHHVPETREAVKSVARKLKCGAPLLIYLYYAFDNRPWWFRMLWRLSDAGRRFISRAPVWLKHGLCEVIALLVYWPIARSGKLLDKLGILPKSWPLSWYRDRSLYVMRTDALDRFGTRLEKRFSRHEIESMLAEAGISRIRFSDRPPFWCAVGIKT
jgi:ubiquinone/menaquinone biosynthesis C-methylase UbiE